MIEAGTTESDTEEDSEVEDDSEESGRTGVELKIISEDDDNDAEGSRTSMEDCTMLDSSMDVCKLSAVGVETDRDTGSIAGT